MGIYFIQPTLFQGELCLLFLLYQMTDSVTNERMSSELVSRRYQNIPPQVIQVLFNVWIDAITTMGSIDV